MRVQDCLFNVQRPCYSVMQEPLESAMSHAGMGRSQGTCQCKAQQAQSRDVFLCSTGGFKSIPFICTHSTLATPDMQPSNQLVLGLPST